MTPVLRWAVLVVALLVYPFADRALGLQTVHAVSDGMIYVLLALGLNIVVGYAGLLDLGYAAFFAIGAYAMGLLNSPVVGSPFYGHGWSFWLCIWVAAAVSALLGTAIGAPTLRVRGDYLAIITLGFGEIIPVAIRNLGDITVDIGGWRPIERLNLTGGENGVNPIGRPHLPGVPFETDPVPWYFLILIVGAVLTILAIAVDLSWSPPWWIHVVWIPVGLALTVAGLRTAKSWLIAQEFAHRAREGKIAP